MLEKRTNWRNRIALSLLIALSILILTVHFRERDQGFLHDFQKWSMNLLIPLQSGVSETAKSVSEAWQSIFEFGKLKSENRDLKQQLAFLRQQLVKMNELEMENKRLREQLNSPIRQNFETISASVISRSINSWQATIVVNRGAGDGVVKNMPVVTIDGLIGQVIATSKNASLVQLLIDQKSAVGVRLQASRATAIIEGQGGRELRINYLPRETKVTKGEVVLTSGFGGVYPAGIVVGTVSEASKGTYGLYRDVWVSPAADLSSLEEVMIITSPPPIPAPFSAAGGS